MSEIKTFYLPDLGEGLPDAEVVEWHVKEGDKILLDEPLVSMETAKAVVDVPSPFSGTVAKLFGQAGDVIATGAPLAAFEIDASLPQRADAEDTGHHHAPPVQHAQTELPNLPTGAGQETPQEQGKLIASDEGGVIAAPGEKLREDSGTVVGAMESSNRVMSENVSVIGGVKAMPAVRALAKKLGVDLSRISPSGADGVVTMQDVKNFTASAPAMTPSLAERESKGEGRAPQILPSPQPSPASERGSQEAPLSAAGKPMRTAPATVAMPGQPEPLRGVRRNMARIMAAAHASVVPTTLTDDADIHAWLSGTDITARLIRSLVVAARAVPALNAWFDAENSTRTLHQRVDVGIAIDTDDGLFVPALRNADVLDPAGIRQGINRLRDQVRDRSISPDELKGYTISLSNFGVFAGRYATPVVVPPCVAIVAAGKLRHELRPVMGGIETHRIIPLSLTFDHRAVTGGEAARFLKAMLDDLSLST